MLFHLLHPFDSGLIGAGEYCLYLSEFRAQLKLSPLQIRQGKLLDVPQPKLRPNFRRGFGNHGMRQCGHDAQGLGAGVQNRGQMRPAFVVLLFPSAQG